MNNRRDFLKSSAAATAASLTAGFTATSRGYFANETINVACIGTGGRCRKLMESLVKVPGDGQTPARFVRRGEEAFVKTIGGYYLFMPAIPALRRMAKGGHMGFRLFRRRSRTHSSAYIALGIAIGFAVPLSRRAGLKKRRGVDH